MLFKAKAIIEAIQALGYGVSLNTGLNRWLAGMTGRTGSTNDLWFNYLRGLGYTGSLNDMMAAYYAASNGAAITSPIPSLFRNGEKGVWYDPSDLTSMFQDSAGTTAAVVGQPVGLMLDKSKGLVLGSELVTNGGFDTDTAWTKGTGWSITSGYASITNAAATSNLSQEVGYVLNSFYQVDITLTITAGSLSVLIGNGVIIKSLTSSGTYSIKGAATGGAPGILFLQAAAGTTCSVDLVSSKALPGYHATQVTTGAKPILARHPIGGRRNLLTYTEDFSNAAWQIPALVTPNAIVAPDGTLTADLIVVDTTNDRKTQGITATVAGAHTLTVYVKAYSGNTDFKLLIYNNTTATTVASSGTILITSGISVGDGWYRHSLTSTSSVSVGNLITAYIYADGTNTHGQGNYFWGAQLELGSTPTAYQKVTSTYDVTEAGVNDAYYLKFDGLDDWMVTPSIDFSATDKMSVFAGVRKLSDAAVGVLVELSTQSDLGNGSFGIYVPLFATQPEYTFHSRSSAGNRERSYYRSYVSPITNVISASLSTVAADAASAISVRINGSLKSPTGSDITSVSTGVYGNYPLYIGMRAGTSLPFNGHLYGLIVRGALSDAAQITAAESYVNSKTGAWA